MAKISDAGLMSSRRVGWMIERSRIRSRQRWCWQLVKALLGMRLLLVLDIHKRITNSEDCFEPALWMARALQYKKWNFPVMQYYLLLVGSHNTDTLPTALPCQDMTYLSWPAITETFKRNKRSLVAWGIRTVYPCDRQLLWGFLVCWCKNEAKIVLQTWFKTDRTRPVGCPGKSSGNLFLSQFHLISQVDPYQWEIVHHFACYPPCCQFTGLIGSFVPVFRECLHYRHHVHSHQVRNFHL